MPEERLFSEQQAAEILKKAAVLHDFSTMSPGASMFTLQDLQRIGREAGLDPGAVTFAADLATEPGQLQHTRVFGAPTSYQIQRTLNHQLSPQDWELLVMQMNESYRQDIEGECRASFFQWRFRHSAGHVELSALNSYSRCRLDLNVNIDGGLTMAWGAGLLAMIIGSVTVWENLPTEYCLVINLLLWLGTYLLVRRGCRSWLEKDQLKAARVMNTLLTLISMPEPDQLAASTKAAEVVEQHV